MSWMDEYYKAKKKKEEEESNTVTPPSNKSSFMADYYSELDRLNKQKEKQEESTTTVGTLSQEEEEDIAPTRTWFQKGLFEDGYDFGDVTKTLIGSVGDIGENLFSGAIGSGEKMLDALSHYGAAWNTAMDSQNSNAYMFDINKYKTQQKELDEFAAKDLYDEEAIAKQIISAPIKDVFKVDTEADSVFGEKSDALAQSAGQMLLSRGLNAVGVPWQAVTGLSSFGAELENALREGATHEEAGMSAAISAGAEVLSESLFGGSMIGEKGMINLDPVTRGISNKLVKTLADFGVDMVAEGGEEIVSEVASRLGSALYKEENLTEILASEEALDAYLESFIGGMALGGIGNVRKAANSAIKGTDYRSDFNLMEQKVVDKLYEQELSKKDKLTAREKSKLYESISQKMERGYIDADDIESVLGGESYQTFAAEKDKFFNGETYKSWQENKTKTDELKTKIEELGKKTDATLMEQVQFQEMRQEFADRRAKQTEQKTALDAEAKRIMDMRNKMRNDVISKVSGTRLEETYRELARSKQKFQVDVNKYQNENARKTVESILKSGLGDNTNQFHDTVEWLASISEQKGVTFDLTSNDLLKGTQHYREGYVTNGFVTEDGVITLNTDSDIMRSTVGHEITHVLEKAGVYKELASAVRDFAIAKEGMEGYNARMNAIKEIYGNNQTKIDSELTADIVGEYLFTDSDFVNSLSANRSTFEYIYNEIKHLWKMATAGSKEKRELERVKRLFDHAWQENVKGNEARAKAKADEIVKKVSKEVQKEFDEASRETKETNDDTQYSIRKEAPPTKTEKAYKLMRLVDGDLYPLFIGNNEKVSVGTWYNADSPNLSQLKDLPAGTHLVNMETGEAITWDEYAEQYVPRYKSGKFARSNPNNDDIHWANDNGYRFMRIEEKTGTSAKRMEKQYGDTRAYYNYGINGDASSETGEGSASLYALRPGWHFGEVPSMHQIGYGDNKDVRLDNQVWVEVDMSADVDYNEEAASNWGGDIPTHIPTDGYYKFATNPTQKKTKKGTSEADNTKADWYVAGAFKVNRILSDSEADAIVNEYNQKNGKNVPLDYRRSGGRVFNAETMSVEDPVGRQYLDSKSIQYSYSAIPTHKKSLEKNFDLDNASMDLETINQRYDKIIGIWEKLGGELDSKFLNDWNNKVERPFTIFKAQSGYKYNVELSSMCKKGVPLFEAIDTIVKKEVMKELDMKVMGKEEKEILYDILKQKHFEIPCAICYVEQARQREGVVIDAFLNGKSATDKKGADVKLGWNQVLDNIQKEMKANGADYTFNFVSRDIATDKYIPAESDMDEQTYAAFAEAVKKLANEEITRYNKANGKNRPLLKDVTPEAVKECFKGGLPSNLKIFKVLLTEPSSRFKIQNDLLYSSMTTKNLTMAHNGLYSLFNSQGGVSGYKTKQAPTVYWGEILNKKWKPADTRKEGGIRNQSNSDFQMYTLLDQAQMYMDFSAKGYYLQAYTKVLSELKLFGLSRGKINASLIPQVKVYRNADGTVDVEKTMENAGLDENGNPIYDDIEGINHTEAFMLLEDPEYSKNIGGICIGYSDNHIRKLLDDARVQLIIGFHDKTNDPNKRYRGARYAKNYNGLNEATKTKADGTSETVHIGFNPFVKKAEQKFQYNKDTETFEGTVTYKGKTYTADDIPRLATDLYLEHCAKKNLTPAYNEFSGHPNYYKLLADFSLYDSEGHYAPHQKVAYNMPDTVPYLDADGNKQYMSSEEYIKTELQKELAVRDSLIDALADDSEDGIIPRFKAEVEKRNIAPVKTQYSMTKAVPMEQRLSGDALLDAEDLISEIEHVADVDSNGYVTVYHRTTEDNAKRIMATRKMSAKEDGIFFSTQMDGENSVGYGKGVVKLRVPVEKFVLDDIFDDEAHLRIPLKNRREVLDISEYIDPDSTQYSMTQAEKAKMDEDYFAAIESGDEEVQNHLVREFAKASMPDSKLVDENGNLRVVYHGTNTGDFTVFNPDYIGMSSGDDGFFGMGFYFAYSKGEASYYGARRIIPAYLNLTNPFDFQKELHTYNGKRARYGHAPDAVALMNFADKFPDIAMHITMGAIKNGESSGKRISVFEFAKAFKDVIENKEFDYQEMQNDWGEKETLVTADPQVHEYEYDGEIRSWRDFGFQKRFSYGADILDVAYEYLSNAVYSYIDIPRFTSVILDNNREFTAELKNRGYDGTIQSEHGDEAVAFYPNQIKSAESITRDADGNVIPLSERFNPENDDLRYSISKEGENKGNINDIMWSPHHDEFEDFAPIREDADAYKQKATADKTETVGDNNAPTEEEDDRKPSERRREKSKGYTDFWADLIGDTSTWVDLPLGLSYKTRTLRRILRKVVRDANGKPDIQKADAIYAALETKYDHNEALLKRESAKLKEVFQKLNLNHAEDEYAQMLGELRHNPETTLTPDVVKEYLDKHKGRINEDKVNKAIEESRKLYDDLLVRVNQVLREQGFQEIPYRKGYFPHFTNPKQGILGKIFNWKTIDNEIPTSIAGLTEMFKPNRSWQSFNKRRMGDTTDYSLYQGLDTYIHGALDWVYHIEDLQQRRSLENLIRYTHSEEGVKKRIEEIQNGDYDADEAQNMINAVLEEANNPLGGLVRELMNRTNTLANKKSSMDRAVEDLTSRKVYSVMTNLNNRITANQVVGSLSSALTNFIPMVQSWHQVSPVYTVRGMGDYIRSVVKDDGMMEKSDFLTNRLMEEEKLFQTGWDKVSDKAAFMMNVVDGITSNTVWRSKYLQNLSEGMSERAAIKDADQFAKNLMGGRSRGNAPTIFDAKNPLVKMFTAFQLEVANQYGYMFDDVIKDSKNKTRLVKGYATAFLGAYAYNALYSSLVGRDAAFDPISIIEDLLKGLFDDEEEKEDVLMDFGKDVLEEVPFVGGLMGGGRIPISSAFPYSGYSNPVESAIADINDGKFSKEWLKPLYYLAMPVAGGQVKKTIEGLGMFSDDHPIAGSYTASGNLRFPVEDTFGNRVQAAMFGQYANKNARDYFDNNRSALKPNQIEEFMSSGMPIQDYWEYRDGLKGLDSTAEKADYINSLDLPISTKNMLINNQTDRKNPIDLTGYDEYDDFEEFDWATKNPEKYEFFSELGVSYKDYKNADEEKKRDYNWAYDYPQYVTLSKAVTNDVWEYREYYKDMVAFKADKDANGKSISGSKKAKVIDYINNLNIDYGAKLVLLKSQYESVDDYNAEIFEYIKDKNDLTFEEKLSILKTLGFGVSDDGTVTWD